jgi:hypothetical protein
MQRPGFPHFEKKGLCPKATLPEYWSCQLVCLLFGLFPIIWLPADLVGFPSQIVAFLATSEWQNHAPKYWHA